MWKEVSGVRTYFHYSDEGLVGEYDAAGSEIKTYGYKPGSTWTIDPLFMKVGTEHYFYHNDHLGTPQKMTAVNGAVVWSAKYSSFGKATIEVETVENNLRYPGQYEDTETNLYCNYFRYYDPDIGRYLRTDPVGFGGGDVNLYGYVWNNPVNWVDPLGLRVFQGYSNCLGYGISGRNDTYAWPDSTQIKDPITGETVAKDSSVISLFKNEGYSCSYKTSTEACDCKCNQTEVIIYAYNRDEASNPGISGEDWYTKPVSWPGSSDLHAIRREANSGVFKHLRGADSVGRTPQTVSVAYVWYKDFQTRDVGVLCCCK